PIESARQTVRALRRAAIRWAPASESAGGSAAGSAPALVAELPSEAAWAPVSASETDGACRARR
ncbi:MAG TPA: hypothetical protein VIT43_07545, partial [Candidatus Dormibacteraeota bacterium]